MNLLTKALKCNDLDDALKFIMDALGIESGDVAAQVFSSDHASMNRYWQRFEFSAAVWTTATPLRRVAMLSVWLHMELHDATTEDVE